MELIDRIQSIGGASLTKWERNPLLLNVIDDNQVVEWCKNHYDYEKDHWLSKKYPSSLFYIGFKRALNSLSAALKNQEYIDGYESGKYIREQIDRLGLWVD